MTNQKYYNFPENRHCIWDKNMLNHDHLTVWFDKNQKFHRKNRDDTDVHLGFTIHGGNCRTEEFDYSVATPVYSVHPKLIERTMERFEDQEKEQQKIKAMFEKDEYSLPITEKTWEALKKLQIKDLEKHGYTVVKKLNK